MTVQSNPDTGDAQDQRPRPEQSSLVCRYGQIGIPALAAALRYATPAQNPTGTSAISRIEERFLERAAQAQRD
jgi:hypothetical protein